MDSVFSGYDWVVCGIATVIFAVFLNAVLKVNDEKIRQAQQKAEREFLPQIRGE